MTPRGLTARIAAWVLAHRRFTLALLVAVTALSVLGATRLQASLSSRDFFATSDEGADAIATLDAFTDRWGADDATLLVLAEADVVTTAERRQGLADIAASLRELPDVEEVFSLANLPWVDLAALTPMLVSADRRATVVVVRLTASSDDLAAIIPVMDRLSTAIDGIDGTAGLRLTAAGVPAMRAAFFDLAMRDQIRLGPVVVLAVALALWVAFRRRHAVLVPLVAGGLPLLWLLGAMGWAGEPIGLINQAYFTVLPVIAVADAVHWVQRVHEERRRAPDGRDAIVRAASGVGAACALTSATTAAAFLSLLIVDMEILRRFGLWAAVGIALCWLSVAVVMPLALSVTTGDGRQARHTLSRGIAAWSMRRPALVGALALAVLASAGVAASTLEVDNRLGQLLPRDHPVRHASDRIDTSLGGILTLQVEPSGDAEAFGAWARAQEDVRWAETTHGPDGSRVALHTADMGGQAFAALADRVRRHDPDAIVTGTALVAYTGVNRIGTSLRTSLLGLLLVVTIVIGLALRSLRLALIAVPVNALPLLVGGATLAALGITLDPLAAVVVAVALGIAVDDTLHLLARAAEEQRAGYGAHEAMLRAAEHSGRAILVSTVALGAGLAVQMLSSFPPLRLLGGLGVVIVLVALLVDLTLLPMLATRGQASKP